jgi:hypothetical protein
MEREEALRVLRHVEQEIRRVRDNIAIPAVAVTMRHMEAYCHLALDFLGEVERVCPEAP